MVWSESMRECRRKQIERTSVIVFWCLWRASGVCLVDPDEIRAGFDLAKMSSLYVSCAPSVCSLYVLHSAKKL